MGIDTKAVLSDRIYLSNKDGLVEELSDQLRHTIMPKYTPRGLVPRPKVILDLIKLGGCLSIPIGRQDLIPDGYTIVDKRVCSKVAFPSIVADVSLRETQQDTVDAVTTNCIINAPPAYGKTFTALHIAKKLSLKTLIIVHTTALRDQWESEYRFLFGQPCGVVGGGKDTSADQCVTIGNIQTVRNRDSKWLGQFGLVAIDECLDYGVMVTTREGPVKIGVLVNSKKAVEVLSYNSYTGISEFKMVVDWHKNKQSDLMMYMRFTNSSSLLCTLNHSIYSYTRGKVQAEYLEEGDYVYCAKSFKSSHLVKDEEKPLLLAMIFGDGSLSSSASAVRVKVTHGEAQYEYLEYKKSIFHDAFVADIVNGKSGYCDKSVHTVSTLSFIDVDNWKGKLYGGNTGAKTHAPISITDMLDVDAWAIIYMDDGSISKKTITLSMCAFDDESIKNIVASLVRVFDIAVTPFKCSGGFNYIRISAMYSEKFLNLIAHRIHPSLYYKFGDFTIITKFDPILPRELFHKDITITQVKSISFKEATGGFRYNIEVQDNHNYFANGKLVANCHHTPSKTFNETLNMCKAKYKIGLSATLTRKDGMHALLGDYIGMDVIIPEDDGNYLEPRVLMVDSKIKLPEAKLWTDRVTLLLEDPDYIQIIYDLIQVHVEKGYNILCAASRVELLKMLHEELSNSLLIIGETKDRKDKLEDIKSFNPLLGSMQIFSEGISVNHLDCLVLATPLNNDSLLEQIVGRITRKYEGKRQPLVIDIKLGSRTGIKQADSRLAFYKSKGWSVNVVD